MSTAIVLLYEGCHDTLITLRLLHLQGAVIIITIITMTATTIIFSSSIIIVNIVIAGQKFLYNDPLDFKVSYLNNTKALALLMDWLPIQIDDKYLVFRAPD